MLAVERRGDRAEQDNPRRTYLVEREQRVMSEPARPGLHRYTSSLANDIERRWQDHWTSERTFETPNPSGPLASGKVPACTSSTPADRPKLYILDMFPYPSGSGLHVGHPLGYIASDVFGRFQRMKGLNVLHAFGYDAFGLPAEQYAVQTGQHPRVTTETNVANMRRQLRALGLAHDNRRSVVTTDADYYRWTQWIFLQIFNSWYDPQADAARPIGSLVEQYDSGVRPTPDGRCWHDLGESERRKLIDGHRLVYLSDAPVNWCPGLGTVLANEEVTTDGRSERGNYPVFRRNLRQWMMRITAYADRLLSDLDKLDWPEPIKLMQRNWIGRSNGARVHFDVKTASGDSVAVTVFTTRPETLFGATYLVVAPEHEVVDALAPDAWPTGTPTSWKNGATSPTAAIAAYRIETSSKSEVDRQSDAGTKTGVFTGAYATNPATGARMPVFLGDYVLASYGTGAIMAVPAQDDRDSAFASAFGLPKIRTVAPPEGFGDGAYTGGGQIINSANAEVSLNGLDVTQARSTIIEWLIHKGLGEQAVEYKLRDWLFSRQRYWGEPFPIVYDEHGVVGLPESMLPVELPEVDDYSPRVFDPGDPDTEPESPLARATDWSNPRLDLGDGVREYRRETNTMPQWAGSCWYELRYLDPTNSEHFVDPEIERYWMGPQSEDDCGGVDLYVGGAEHAVLHLLYARFWHKVLFDLGHVSSSEPFRRLFNQGKILAAAYRDKRGAYVPADEVTKDQAGNFVWRGQQVASEYGKMGKSLKNSVAPDDIFVEYGADTLRLYEMSMGPLDVSRPWETRSVVGSYRLLQRLWRNIIDENTGFATATDDEPELVTARILARTIDGVTRDLTALRFNTAIAKLTTCNNHLTKVVTAKGGLPRSVAEPVVLMFAPFAPHIAEELWSRLGHAESLAFEPFPVADESMLKDDTVTCVVQVDGKVRDRLTVPSDIDSAALQQLPLGSEAVKRALAGRRVRKVIVRPPNLVNVVSK